MEEKHDVGPLALSCARVPSAASRLARRRPDAVGAPPRPWIVSRAAAAAVDHHPSVAEALQNAIAS